MSAQHTPGPAECHLARNGWRCFRPAGHGGECEQYPLIPLARIGRWCDTCQVALSHHSKIECVGCTAPDGTMRNWRERWDARAAIAKATGAVK